jgi:rubrerythrin
MLVKDMTETNLRSAYAGESQAHMRYKMFADRAEQSGWHNVARLFGAVSFAERIHAGNHYRNILSKGGFQTVSAAVFGARTTSEDLQAGIDGESFEINEMYPVYKAVAEVQGEKAAEMTFSWALEAEKTHLGLYKKAKEAVDQGKDVALGQVQICSTCGYTVEGDAPDICPVCGAAKKMFKAF